MERASSAVAHLLPFCLGQNLRPSRTQNRICMRSTPRSSLYFSIQALTRCTCPSGNVQSERVRACGSPRVKYQAVVLSSTCSRRVFSDGIKIANENGPCLGKLAEPPTLLLLSFLKLKSRLS